MQPFAWAPLFAVLCHSAAAFDINAHRITDLMAAAYTPMKSGGMQLDVDIIPAYAKYLARRNITNVMPAGSNGESLSLSVAERKALAEAWAAAAPAQGLRVYMHIGSESLVDSMELAKHAAGIGISGIVAMTPVYFKPTLEGLHDYLAAVAGAAPALPLWFYHFPDGTGVLLGQAHKLLELVDKSGRIPNFAGIKYTDYNLMDFQICTKVGHAGKYNMLYGRDEQAFAAMEIGAEAAVSSTCQFAPSLRNVVSLHAKGDFRGAKAAQETNAELCTIFGDFDGDLNVQKNIMKMVGMDVGPSRLPKRDLSAAAYAALQARLHSSGLIDQPLEAVVGPTNVGVTIQL